LVKKDRDENNGQSSDHDSHSQSLGDPVPALDQYVAPHGWPDCARRTNQENNKPTFHELQRGAEQSASPDGARCLGRCNTVTSNALLDRLNDDGRTREFPSDHHPGPHQTFRRARGCQGVTLQGRGPPRRSPPLANGSTAMSRTTSSSFPNDGVANES
jgi:hypothetical protein